jgi:hypothetical protein
VKGTIGALEGRGDERRTTDARVTPSTTEGRKKKAPAEAGALDCTDSGCGLEGQLRGELHAARTASAQERVADTYVAGRSQAVVATVLSGGSIG